MYEHNEKTKDKDGRDVYPKVAPPVGEAVEIVLHSPPARIVAEAAFLAAGTWSRFEKPAFRDGVGGRVSVTLRTKTHSSDAHYLSYLRNLVRTGARVEEVRVSARDAVFAEGAFFGPWSARTGVPVSYDEPGATADEVC